MNASAHITLDQVTFQYTGKDNTAIQSINLDIHEGDFLLLTGKSGCGKTTIARLINGLIPHFYEGNLEGTTKIGENDTRKLDIGKIGKLVGSVFQDPRSQFFMTDTTSEVAFGCVNAGLARTDIMARMDDAFCRMKIDHLRDKSVFNLSSGEMQMIAIASCYAMKPSIYIFDEPSANLDIEAVATLRKTLSKLKREGKTVIVLEHRLFYLSGLFDRMIVIKDGVISHAYSAKDAARLNDGLLSDMGLRSLTLESALRITSAASQCSLTYQQFLPQTKEINFEVKNLGFSYCSQGLSERAKSNVRNSGAIGPLSFSAQSGEVIGIIGQNGAGKTTLSRLCCGLEKENQGSVSIDGKPLSPKERLGRIRLIMQDPDYQLFSDSVLGELLVGGRRDIKACQYALRELGLWDMREAHPATLSRGQKQRLTIACALVDKACVYFFDEPTSGLDRENMERVASAIQSLARSKRIVFAVSHDFEFLLSACTRILHLKDSRIVDDFVLSGSTRERLLNLLWREDAQ
ncbi:ABC transporter ATP-binding protein [Atopobium fossor]|uniref:ABC transporter ATP-binding protein n=1 Tax=Atopobium fossor TaxID=39487 RepID=UPI0003F9F8E4|nr:ABC transporter ATP-binding protein [Atopobium fossor]